MEDAAQHVSMVERVKTKNASVAQDMQESSVKNLCARKNVRTEEDVLDQTDVLVCMAIRADTAKSTTERVLATGRLKMTSAQGNCKEWFALSSSAVLPLERRGDILVNDAQQS